MMEDITTALPVEQTRTLRLAILLSEQGTCALKGLVMFELFNTSIQKKRGILQTHLSQEQYDELFSGQTCPHFNELPNDVLEILTTCTFNLPRVTNSDEVKILLKCHLEGDGISSFLKGYSAQICAKKILSKKQLSCLFPTVNINNLDITLLSFLLFELFGVKPTTLSYTTLPSQNNTQIGDDVLRLRWYRNEIAHGNNAGISQSTFESTWKDVSGALLRIMGVQCKASIDALKSKSIDGPLLSEYTALVEKWHQDDKDMCVAVDKLTLAISDVNRSVGNREYQHRVWCRRYFQEVLGEQTNALQQIMHRTGRLLKHVS